MKRIQIRFISLISEKIFLAIRAHPTVKAQPETLSKQLQVCESMRVFPGAVKPHPESFSNQLQGSEFMRDLLGAGKVHP